MANGRIPEHNSPDEGRRRPGPRVSELQPASAARIEGRLLALALGLAVLLPLADAAGRPFGSSLPGSAAYLQQLTLWLTFLGGLVATRERAHLTLSTAELLHEGRPRRLAALLACCVAAATAAVL